MNILRTIIWFSYFYGYLVFHWAILHKAERLFDAGDRKSVDKITEKCVNEWCSTLLKLAGVTITVEGKENIPQDRACVFVANHRSQYDIPVILTQLGKPYGLLAKAETKKLPLVRGWMRVLGCVFVDRKDVRASMIALQQGIDEVKSGRSFTIFPEGTRHKGEEGSIGEFKGGAFRIALKTGAPIIPVAILNSREAMENHNNLMHPAHITVRILPTIETNNLSKAEQKDLPLITQQLIKSNLK